jgi:cyanophycin synthetase
VEGINDGKTTDIPVKIIPDEKEAIVYAYQNAKPGAIVTIMCDVVPETIAFIKKLKEDEDSKVNRLVPVE